MYMISQQPPPTQIVVLQLSSSSLPRPAFIPNQLPFRNYVHQQIVNVPGAIPVVSASLTFNHYVQPIHAIPPLPPTTSFPAFTNLRIPSTIPDVPIGENHNETKPQDNNVYVSKHSNSSSIQTQQPVVTNTSVHVPAPYSPTTTMCNTQQDSQQSEHSTRMKRNKQAGRICHVCPDCGKVCSKKSNLTQHIRVHTGEKPFKCNICGRGFSQNHSLKEHIRTHTGVKPYACNYCPKRFTVRHNLTVHIRTHS